MLKIKLAQLAARARGCVCRRLFQVVRLETDKPWKDGDLGGDLRGPVIIDGLIVLSSTSRSERLFGTVQYRESLV